MAYIRKYKTSSGATAVQVCYKEGRKVVKIEHVGSASSEEGMKKLLQKAQGIIDQDKKSLFDLRKYSQ